MRKKEGAAFPIREYGPLLFIISVPSAQNGYRSSCSCELNNISNIL